MTVQARCVHSRGIEFGPLGRATTVTGPSMRRLRRGITADSSPGIASFVDVAFSILTTATPTIAQSTPSAEPVMYDVRITQLVDGNVGVHVIIPKAIFTQGTPVRR